LEDLVENKLPSIITSPVLPGTIQLTPSGKLIILMKDCQTSGGYPRVLQLDAASMVTLSQKYTREVLKFKMISIS
jgi:allophanate hydrolase subunit 2